MNIKRSIPLLTFGLIIAFLSCTDFGNGPPPPPQLRPLSAAELKVVHSVDQFWLSLFQAADATTPNENVFISPLSISMALGMALNGAAGETMDSIRHVLSFEGYVEEDLNKGVRSLIALLRSADPGVDFRIANSMWHERSFDVEPGFLHANTTYYDARIEGLDFGSPSAVTTINGWVKENTNGKIESIVDQISPEIVLYLINTIYFKGEWTMPFDPSKTRPRDFFLRDGSTVQRTMMDREDTVSYFWSEGAQAVELPYGGGHFSMVIILPPEGIDVSNYLKRLDQSEWKSILEGFSSAKLALTMPKFRFMYDLDLEDPLTSLGMGIAFDETRADFRRISEEVYRSGRRLYISKAKHSSFVDVNEKGTEAAAATSIGIGVTSLPPSMTVNRPFIFVIRERSTGTVLFAGRVLDPVVE